MRSHSSLGDAATATITTNKFKAKMQKNQAKLKTKSRRNSKQIQKPTRPKSFLEENIKKAGNTASRRRSDQPSDDLDTDPENAIKGTKATDSISESSTKSKNIAVRKNTSREQKALHSAYTCCMDEYYRRTEVRKTISVKFGRANAKLKLMMAQKKVGDQTQKESGLAALISKRKAQDKDKQQVKDKDSKKGGKSFAKVQDYDDPDRI